MDDARKSVHGFGVDEDFQFHEVGGAVACAFVIHGAVAAGEGFDFVVEVHEDFVEGDEGGDHDAAGVDRLRVVHGAAFFHHELHHVADVFVGDHDEAFDDGFADFLDDAHVGEVGWVIDFQAFAVGADDFVDDARVGGDDVHVVFAAEAFLDDFHVEESEEAAAEAEAEGDGAFGLEDEGGVVDLEFAHGGFEVLEVRGVDRVNPAEDHGVDFLEARESFGGRAFRVGQGVADFDFGGGFDICDEVADIPRVELGLREHFWGEDADLFDFVVLVGGEEFNGLSWGGAAAENPHVADDAAVAVEDAVEDEGAEGVVALFRRGDAGDDRFQNVFDADACFGAARDGIFAGDGEEVFDLLADGFDIGVWEVDFVDDGDDYEVVFRSQVDIGNCLRFNALGCIHDEDRAFASGEAAGDFIRKVHMARGIQQIEAIVFAVLRVVFHGDGVGFDGDAPLPFEVHGIQELVLFFPFGDRSR